MGGKNEFDNGPPINRTSADSLGKIHESAMSDTDIQAVETPAPDANVPEVENVAAPSPAVDSDDKPKGVGKRIDELTRNWRETERDRDHWREMAMRNQSPQPKAEPADPHQAEKELADFNFDEVAYRKYLRAELETAAAAAAKRELTAERERQEADRRKSSFKSRSVEFAKTVDDFDSVAYARDLPISGDMAEVIQDSDDGPALLYHLGKNPEIAEKIAQLPPKAAARELGKIEARLAFEKDKAKEAKATVSKAPAPPPKVEGSEPGNLSVSASDPESDNLSAAEWVKLREKELARKRK